MPGSARSAMVVASTLVALTRLSAADIYSYEDKEGVIHFTNVTPAGGAGSKWRVIYKTGPGKAMAVSGAASSSYAQCRVARADVVPARDRAPERYRRYDAFIVEASQLYAIPEALIRAVIKVESDYDPNVVSCAGAKGLMQVMPYEETSERIEQVFDPRQNILAGARMLRRNANVFRGDIVRTIASYHAGIGAVTKYGGIPPYQTTQSYVRMVLKHYERYRGTDVTARAAKGEG